MQEVGDLDQVFESARQGLKAGEPAAAFTCPLTMEVFRDPVMTPSGLSYERSALVEHLKKVWFAALCMHNDLQCKELVWTCGLQIESVPVKCSIEAMPCCICVHTFMRSALLSIKLPRLSADCVVYLLTSMLKPAVQVGTFDPITREAMTASQAIPNVALRNATLQYLEEHPWAWAECC